MKFISIAVFTTTIVMFGIFLTSCEDTVNSNGDDGQLGITPIELLPRDGDIGGWMRDGIPIEATNYDALYQVIDGGAQKYIDNGFVSAVFQDYKSVSGLSLQLQIYELATVTNVNALYDELTPVPSRPWIGGISDGRIDESALTVYTVEFIKGRFFVRVSINEKSETALEIAKLFASHVANEIPEATL
jgi:hypothetical protein